uniref:Multidrug-efflux transporter n=1 Tax=Candidatus Kentrum sp. FW TaxID=2126338 RepID=A0A450T613_9GAMM|nr:MAG: multidrug resistance protein, MATE family [Candidatus Kentron sp. FW]VFJ62387.1 MAG: multidrug resistance protein, MATE family [Candidatus Kentron sp. FW]
MTNSKRVTVSDLRAILKLSLPLSFGYLGEVAIGFTDIIMLGRLGPDALGAAGLAFSIYNVILIIGIGMSFPAMVLISQARGAGRSRAAHGIIRQGLWITGFLSVPSCAILWHLEDILLLTGQDITLVEMASRYMDYYLWTMPPALTSFMFLYALTSMERSATIALVLWFDVGLNAVLNYLLIFGKFGFPAMGMAGAGLASIIVYITSHMIFFGIFGFYRFFRSPVVFLRAWQPKGEILGQFVRLGWPKGLELLMVSGLYSGTALLAGRFGVQAIASHTIAYQLSLLIGITISIAVANAVATRAGIAKGQDDFPELWRILNSGLSIIILFIVPLIVLIKIFSPWIVIVFAGSESKAQTLLPIAAPLIVLVAFFVLVDGLRMVIGMALNGLSDMKIPTLIAGVAHWVVGFPAGVMLGFTMELGIQGLWWGLTISMTVTAFAYLMRFRWMLAHGLSPVAGNDDKR